MMPPMAVGEARSGVAVRSVADWVLLPPKNLLDQVGDMMVLTGKTVLSTVRPPYPYGGEFVQQFLFLMRLCWMPLTVSTVAICYGAPGLQAGNALILFGAIDRLGGFALASLTFDAPLGPFFATLLTNASTTDLWGSVVKCMLFGAIIAIVSCYKGMTASGGAEGVGRAVNQGVVIEFLDIFAFNYVFTQTLLATHPEISVIK